jgi:uncharacterized protein
MGYDAPMTSPESMAAGPTGEPFDEQRERRIAWRLLAVVLVALTVAKPLGGIPYVGATAFTIAAALQLYLPMWRAEKLGLPYSFIGLHFGAWRRDLRLALWLSLLILPPYALAHHLYMTRMHGWALGLGLTGLAAYLPQAVFAPHLPATASALGHSLLAVAELVATHVLGVALPEETFYRGYLLPRLEALWPPQVRLFGGRLGRAAVVTAFFFAAGHFLGEWNPLRWGPFFPALVFAWQRSATGTVVGAIGFHAVCNLYGEALFSLYLPG